MFVLEIVLHDITTHMKQEDINEGTTLVKCSENMISQRVDITSDVTAGCSSKITSQGITTETNILEILD